jgi:hypothetical protein
VIRETQMDKTLNRLSSHFGERLRVRPPASAAELAGLEAMVGPLPRELTILLSTCDGLRVEAEGFDSHAGIERGRPRPPGGHSRVAAADGSMRGLGGGL